jgi:hypothetical protein
MTGSCWNKGRRIELIVLQISEKRHHISNFSLGGYRVEKIRHSLFIVQYSIFDPFIPSEAQAQRRDLLVMASRCSWVKKLRHSSFLVQYSIFDPFIPSEAQAQRRDLLVMASGCSWVKKLRHSSFLVQYSIFTFPCSVFDIHFSLFSIRYSLFPVQYSIFDLFLPN